MSNNSWKQYGGQSKADEYNIINATTIVADQFVSRSVKTGEYFLSGSLEVSNDISAGSNIIAGNTLSSQQNLFVKEDIYSNKKIYFGAGTEFINSGTNFPILASDNSNVFIYGDASFVAINALSSDATFQINGTNDETKNIFVVESANDSLRNILGQNKNNYGVALNVNDSSSNILFYNDTSTNIVNEPNANISYISNGTLMQNTTNDFTSTGVLKLSSNGKILHSSDIFQVDNSGGRIYMDNSGFVLDSSGAIVLNAYGIVVEASGGNMLLDVSGNYLVKNNETQLAVSENNVDISSNNITLSSTNGNIGFDASGGKLDVISDSTNFYTQVKMLSLNQDSSSNVFNETLTVFDSSNNVYLENVYDISGIHTGSVITGVSKDASSNTFMHLTSRNTQQGAAYGGGVYPFDTSRSMNTIGINDNSGNYVMNQTIVSNKGSAKYLSTMGINTFAPKTNEYVMDLNGPMRISNGEINNVANTDFEIQSVSFSKNNLLYGIACGTPNVLNDLPTTSPSFSQKLLYTHNGGIQWLEADVYNNSATLDDLLINFNSSCLYDANYGIIGGNSSYLYYTNNGGSNWYRMQYYESGSDFFTDNTYRDTNSVIIVSYNSNLRVYIAYKYNDPDGDPVDTFTKQIRYFDIPIASLSSDLNGDTYKISTFNEISITSDINISYGTNSANYLYYVGNGIMKIQISDSTIAYTANATSTYYHIYAYDDNFVIAVGDNIISYTNDGTIWTNIAIDTNTSLGSNIILNHVHIYDTNNISVVGNNGVFAYTTLGPEESNWQLVPNTILNSSGNAHLINDSQNTLKTVHMVDKNTLIISNVLVESSNTTDDTNDITGRSKLFYVFLPNLYFKLENNLLDICGNMMISGNIQTYDGYIGIGKAPSALTALDISANNAIQLPIGNNTQRPVSDNSGDSYKGLLRYNNEIDQFEGYGSGGVWGPLGGTDANGDLEVENNLVVKNLTITDDISANDISANTLQARNLNIVNPITSETIVNISTTNYDEINVEEDITVNGRIFVNEITNTGKINTQNLYNSGIMTTNGFTANSIDAGYGTFSYITANNGTSSIGSLNITGVMNTDGFLTVDKDITTKRAFVEGEFTADYATFDNYIRVGSININNNNIDSIVNLSTDGIVAQVASIQSLDATTSLTSNETTISNRLFVIKDVSFNSNLYINKNATFNNINTFNTARDGEYSSTIAEFPSDLVSYTLSQTATTETITLTSGENILLGDYSWSTSLTSNNNNRMPLTYQLRGNTGSSYNYSINEGVGNNTVNEITYVDNSNSNITITDTSTASQHWIRLTSPKNMVISQARFATSVGTDLNKVPKNIYIVGTDADGVKRLLGSQLEANLSTQSTYHIDLLNTPVSDVYFIYQTRGNFNAMDLMSFQYLNVVLEDTEEVPGIVSNTISVFNKNVGIGTTNPGSALDVNGNINTTGNLSISGDLSLNNRLFVDGDASFNSGLFVGGDVSLNDRLFVGGDASFNSSLFVGGDVSLNDRLFVGGDVSFNSGIYVSGGISWNSANIANDSIPQSAIIGGVGSNDMTGLVSIDGDLSLNNRIFIGGDASFNSGLYVSGDVSFNSGIYVSGDLSWNSANIANDSIPQSAIIGGVGSNDMTGLVSIDGDLSLNDRLFVGGNASFNGEISVVGDVSLNSELYVAKSTTFDGVVRMNAVQNIINYGTLSNIPYSITGNFPGNQTSDRNSYTMSVSSFTGSDTWKNGNYTVSASSFTTYSQYNPENVFNTNVSLKASPLTSYRWTSTFADSTLSYVNTDGSSSSATGSAWIAIALPFFINLTSVYFYNGNYNVSSIQVIGEDTTGTRRLLTTSSGITLNTYHTVSITTDYYVNKIYFYGSDQLGYLSYDGTSGVIQNIHSALIVNNNATITGDLSINTGLYVSGDVSWNSANIANDSIPQSAIIGGVGSNDFTGLVSIDGDLSLNNRLFVGGDASFNSNLYVFGDISWNSANIANDSIPQSAIIGGNNFTGLVSIDGDLSLNNRLFVGGDVSFNSRLYINNDTTFNNVNTFNPAISGVYSSTIAEFPSDLVSYTLSQTATTETITLTSGENILLGDYSWSTSLTSNGNNRMPLTHQLRGNSGSSYNYSINEGVGTNTVNEITYVDNSNSNITITDTSTASQHWIRLTSPKNMVISQARFATSSGNDTNKVPKNIYIVGTDADGVKRLLGSRLEADLTYQTTYYIDLLNTPVSDVYFIYQTRGNFNAMDLQSFQYLNVVLQETEEVAGLVSDAISIFNKNVGIGNSAPATLLSVGDDSDSIPFVVNSYNTSYPPLLNIRDDSYADAASIAHFSRGDSVFQLYAQGFYHQRGNGDIIEIKTSSGNVFFGNQTRDTHIRFDTNGTIAPSTSFSSAYSDDRIKFNETDISNCLTIVRQLSTPQKYERFIPKDENDQIQAFPTDASWNEIKSNNDINYYEEIGFIAQEVKQIPELSFSVRGEEQDASGNNTPLLLDYGNIHNITTGAVKELDAIVQQQQTIIQQQQTVITALEQRVAALENAST